MQLFYNAFDLGTLGELFFTSSREPEIIADQPQRTKVTLRVRLEVFAGSYDQNRALIEAAVAAVAAPQGLLRWRNEAAGVDYVNQTVTLTSAELPEEWGQYHQVLTLVFSYFDQSPAVNNLPLTFLKEGSGAPLKLDVVTKWVHSAGVERFTSLRKHRKETRGKIQVQGQFFGDTTQPLADRRAALLASVAAFNEAMNGAEGVMTYAGVFQGVVRVEDWSCEVDQVINAIPYSFTAHYTLLPDEAAYATAEFSAEERDTYNGTLRLELGGRIQAATEAQARTKLAEILAVVLGQRGYDTAGKPEFLDSGATTISANEDGDTFTELSFRAGYQRWKDTNLRAFYQKTGGKAALSLGEVNRWRDHYAAQRFNEQRSERRHATGSIEAAGFRRGDMSLPLAERRAQLLAWQRQMKAEVNSSDGLLKYGDWSQTVRVEDFQVEIDQFETGLEWTLAASYSLFPSEGGYATAEFTINARANVEDGDEFMTFAGRISATNGQLARAKLQSLRTTILGLYGWKLEQRLRTDANLTAVDANGDRTAGIAEGLEAADKSGATFLELTFNEEYRRRTAGGLVSSTLSVVQREDIATQTLLTTYAGMVTATGPNAGAAYTTALERAQALGANREAAIDDTAYLRGSTIAQEQRQTQLSNDVEFLRLSFNYEYQSKLAAGRAYLELSTTTSLDTFGTDMEACVGSVIARDAATAEAIYLAQVRPLYADRLIHNEQTGVGEQAAQQGTSWNRQVTRFDFNLSVLRPKVAAAGVTFKYGLEVARDFLTLELRTVVSGSCYAANRVLADDALTTLLAGLKLGSSVRSRRLEDRERNAAGLENLLKLDFEEEFSGRVTGTSGLLELRLSEKLVYSGTRWAVQNLPFADGVRTGGVSIPQPAGLEPGSRTISGSVTAGTEATALAWARKQRAMLTGDANKNRFPQPAQEDTEFEWVPRVDGVARGTGANVRVYRVNFTYSEILPLYPAPS